MGRVSQRHHTLTLFFNKFSFINLLLIMLTQLIINAQAQSIGMAEPPKNEINIQSWLHERDVIEPYYIDNTIILSDTIEHVRANRKEKDWTIILYLAADNDLSPFAIRNIRQMAHIGSTSSINILVHLDIRTAKNKKITRRFYVKKDKLVQLNANDPTTQRMDSGDPQTLISCFKWGVKEFPAKHYGLILWNHGTGPLDPSNVKIFNANELFTYNALTNKLDLDRSIGFLEYMRIIEDFSKVEQRGICWDDSTGNYLTNQKLEYALKTICSDPSCLNGKKIDLIAFDACLMNSIEVMALAKKCAHIAVGSQEVVLGSGYPYDKLFKPFLNGTLNPDEFACHIVDAFSSTYHSITNDYTQSALKLGKIYEVETNINILSHLLMEGLKKQANGSVKKTIAKSCNRKYCTHFDEPSYIDLYHFLSNLEKNIEQFKINNKNEDLQLKKGIKEVIATTKQSIDNAIIKNSTGENLKGAYGLSVYFPQRRIHSSYKKTIFAATNSWLSFLRMYLLS